MNGTHLALGSVALISAAGFAAHGSANPDALSDLRTALHAARAPAGSRATKGAAAKAPAIPAKRLVEVADAFLRVDPRAASDADLVAVLLAGSTTVDPLVAAADLLHDLGGDLARASRAEGFLGRDGLQPLARARMLASSELARRAGLRGAIQGTTAILSAADSLNLARALVGGTVERLGAIYVDRRLRVLGTRILSKGNSSSTIVDPAEVLRPAIEMHATALILVHNHPSGDGSASREDDTVTSKIAQGARLLGLSLLDHVVMGRAGSHTSYAQEKPSYLS